MKQSRLGISVGLLCAAVYFLGLFSGYLAVIILVGYILLVEENAWLRKNAVKALALMMIFSLITAIVNLIPGVISFVNDVFVVFGGKFNITFLNRLANAIVSAIGLVEKVTLLLFGIKSIHQSSISIPLIDGLIETYME